MTFGRQTCGVRYHIVLNGSPSPKKGKLGIESQPKICHCFRVPIYTYEKNDLWFTRCQWQYRWAIPPYSQITLALVLSRIAKSLTIERRTEIHNVSQCELGRTVKEDKLFRRFNINNRSQSDDDSARLQTTKRRRLTTDDQGSARVENESRRKKWRERGLEGVVIDVARQVPGILRSTAPLPHPLQLVLSFHETYTAKRSNTVVSRSFCSPAMTPPVYK